MYRSQYLSSDGKIQFIEYLNSCVSIQVGRAGRKGYDDYGKKKSIDLFVLDSFD
jgi:hypothetical protein